MSGHIIHYRCSTEMQSNIFWGLKFGFMAKQNRSKNLSRIGFQSKQSPTTAASSLGLGDSSSRSSSSVVVQPSPSRVSVSSDSGAPVGGTTGQGYSLVSGTCPHCNHSVLSLNSTSVLEDCGDEGVFSGWLFLILTPPCTPHIVFTSPRPLYASQIFAGCKKVRCGFCDVSVKNCPEKKAFKTSGQLI